MSHTVRKFPVECYSIHRPRNNDTHKGGDWATICISENGSLWVNSDYGAWAYYWSHPGMPFRDFLCKIDADYLLQKLLLNRPKHFNCDRTVERINGWITETEGRLVHYRGKEVRFTEYMVSDAREALEEIGMECHASADVFAHRCIESDELGWLYQRAEDGICVMEHDPQCVAFVDGLWPLFVDELKREKQAP